MLGLVKQRYYWDTWSRDVKCYVDNCLICKRKNNRRDLPPGLLQPLPIPERLAAYFYGFLYLSQGPTWVWHGLCGGGSPEQARCLYSLFETTTSQGMAKLFIERVYPWTGPPDTI
jgi:hypothetical protein